MLSRVHSATPEQLLEMQHEQANPKNAMVSGVVYTHTAVICHQAVVEKSKPLSHPHVSLQGTLDVGLIDSVCASDNPDR